MFDYTKKRIDFIADKNDFLYSTTEKVYRLLDFLREFDNIDQNFKLVLKVEQL